MIALFNNKVKDGERVDKIKAAQDVLVEIGGWYGVNLPKGEA